MKLKLLLDALAEGKTVTFTVRRLRGYLHGDISLVLRPSDLLTGTRNICHKLHCFRHDERPYDKPRWVVSEVCESSPA